MRVPCELSCVVLSEDTQTWAGEDDLGEGHLQVTEVEAEDVCCGSQLDEEEATECQALVTVVQKARTTLTEARHRVHQFILARGFFVKKESSGPKQGTWKAERTLLQTRRTAPCTGMYGKAGFSAEDSAQDLRMCDDDGQRKRVRRQH